VVARVVGAEVGGVVFGAVVALVVIFAVVGAVVGARVVTGAVVVLVVGEGVTLVVATVVACEDAVVSSGDGTVVAELTVALVVGSAPETGKVSAATSAASSRPAARRRTPRIFDTCMHNMGEVGSKGLSGSGPGERTVISGGEH
jgi:hypothetical protein